MARTDLTAQRLRELLDYNPDTGEFTWRFDRFCVRAGAVAGLISKGYVYIGIDGDRYAAHRLAWLWVHGVWPVAYVDHINQNKADNRLSNLREATHAENSQNCGLRSHNKSGFKGVSFCKFTRRWRATIKGSGKQTHLGRFATPQEAHQAYCAAAAQIHTHRPVRG